MESKIGRTVKLRSGGTVNVSSNGVDYFRLTQDERCVLDGIYDALEELENLGGPELAMEIEVLDPLAITKVKR